VNAQELISKLEALKAERSTWENHWQELTDYILPNRNDVTNTRSPGEKRNVQIVDSTAVQANQLLAGALHGLLTNPSAFWFEYTTGDPELDRQDDVRRWLQKAALKTHEILNNSNFQTEIHEIYQDLGCIGTAALSIEEDEEKIVRFAARHISEIFVEESNLGVIDSVFRSFKWTARQVLQEFGDKTPDEVKKMAEMNSTDKLEIIHAVYPRKEFSRKSGPESYAFASDYLYVQKKLYLARSGFREFPYAIPRWTKASGEVYGRSAGMAGLPDIKMINEMMKTVIRGAQKTVDPPVQMPDDGFIFPLIVTPGGVNYYRSGSNDRIEAFANDARIDFGFQVLESIRQRIRECFYVDQLQLAQGPQMTATEVMQRTEEKMRLMGPVLGRQHSELLRPLIDRVFAIMVRREQIPQPIPEVLSGKKIDVHYSSLIAKSQKMSEGQNLQRALQAAAPFIQIDPSTADNINGDAALREIISIYGVTQNILRDQKEVDDKRKARDEANREALQQQQEQHQADQVSKMGPALAKVKEAGIA
jgi:hypothetical protein